MTRAISVLPVLTEILPYLNQVKDINHAVAIEVKLFKCRWYRCVKMTGNGCQVKDIHVPAQVNIAWYSHRKDEQPMFKTMLERVVQRAS